jgi:transcriptional regulator with XRE-family HTH domain
MYAEGFPSKLKKARNETGFTLREVAKELHIPHSTIGNYEIGRTQPDIETLGVLLDFYGVSADWVIGTKGNTPQQRGRA